MKRNRTWMKLLIPDYFFRFVKLAICTSIFTLAQFSVKAQDENISGKITGVNGDPLSGVTVSVKNSTVTTLTDVDGNFSLSVPPNATLVITYVGYVTQEVPVAGRKQLLISLTVTGNTLEEVVVMGYTTQKKKDLTGSVSIINTQDINGIPVGGIDQIMQG